MSHSPQAALEPIMTLLAANFCNFAALAFLVYDWVINLDEEIHYFWNFREGRKPNAAVILYGLSRYPPMLQAILVFHAAHPMSDVVCQVNQRLQFVASLLGVFPPAIFPAIRAYAVSPNGKALVILSFLLLLVPNIITLVFNALDKVVVLPSPFNCSSVQNPVFEEATSRLILVTKICNIAGESLVLFMTWRKTYTSCRAQRGTMQGPSLAGVLLYNGGTYFLIITVMYILALRSTQTAPGLPLNSSTIITPPMTTVLTCRFLFALRRADRGATTPSSPSAIPSLNFAPAASRLGQSSHRTLPAFIASIGSEVNTGLHFVDSPGVHPDLPGEARTYKDIQEGDEDVADVVDISEEQIESV